jgi:hypothetical protein
MKSFAVAILVTGLLAVTPPIAVEAGFKSMLEPEDSSDDSQLPMGTHRVTDSKGKSYKIYYTGPSARNKKDPQEQYEEDRRRSWEMLDSIIIDAR